MSKRVSSTVTKRKANPRPRKYASASERQAAYRDRAPEVCFRAEPRTVETLDRIAADLDVSRADLVLSMTKFALTNHDWSRFGLTHKPLPFGYGVASEVPTTNPAPIWKRKRPESLGEPVPLTPKQKAAAKAMAKAAGRKYPNLVDNIAASRMENPTVKTTTKRKPTPAQLAARERFAEMARSGAFKKAGAKNRMTTRKANPAGRDAGEFRMTVDGKTVTRFFVHATDDWSLSNGFPYRLLSNVVEYGAPIKFGKTRATVAIDEAADGSPVTETWEIRALKFYDGGRMTNPTKPAASRRGNPVKYRDIAKGVAPGRVQYAVHMPDRPSYHAIAYFTKKADAVDTAQELSDRLGKPVAVTRVQVHFGPM